VRVAPEEQLDEILRTEAIRSVYQPIVELVSGRVVAYEALARGPEGSALERPDLLFAAARRAGRLVELDWACRVSALRGALEAGLPRPLRLFVNVAAEAVDAAVPDDAREIVRQANERLDVVVEITEQAIASRPAELLLLIDRLQEIGSSIALDDVGAVPRSLALMPLLAPDVIKLDMKLVQSAPTVHLASVANAVSAEAERTGAALIAEGIETSDQIEVARALGAEYGQGWYFGRPGPLPPSVEPPPTPLGTGRRRTIHDPRSPFDIVTAERETRRGEKALLLTISRQLERQAAVQGESTIVISAFQHARHFTPKTADHYSALASDLAFVAALGQGIPEEPAPGVRGGSLSDDNPLIHEWHITVVAPHFAAAFVGRDLGDDVADAQRRFDFALTYDRDLAVRAARSLMREITPR
jgi:EAL domain-containing protein (putative c-di-GMP-specific phosphodiesterase class I)